MAGGGTAASASAARAGASIGEAVTELLRLLLRFISLALGRHHDTSSLFSSFFFPLLAGVGSAQAISFSAFLPFFLRPPRRVSADEVFVPEKKCLPSSPLFLCPGGSCKTKEGNLFSQVIAL